MKPVLLVPAAALAALTLPAVPAAAQRWSDPGFIAAANVTVHRDSALVGVPLADRGFEARFPRAVRGFDPRFCRDLRRRHRDGDDDDDGFRRGHRVLDCAPFFGGELGYLDPGDYDANRSLDADKWNDWWHERPWRSYPRWVRQNKDCTPDRMWWSGSGWHC